MYWRCEAPAKAVGGKAILLPETAQPKRDKRGRFNGREPSATYSIMQPNDDSAFPWRMLVDRNDPDYWEIEFPALEGTAVWTRPDGARAVLAMAMSEKLGVRTLAEVDDNYLCDPKLNLFLRDSRFDPTVREAHLKAHASMTGIVFSTSWLRDRYHLVTRRLLKKHRIPPSAWPEMHVCRNNVDQADWPERVERDGPVRVGWMGSPSHLWDIHLAWAAMLHAKRNLGCDTWIVGYNPADPDLTRDAPLYEEARRKAAQWAKVGFNHVPWVKPRLYQRFPLPFDIGLAPLETNDFTLGKSDVKAIEYAIAGAAPVLWNNPVYNRDWVHGETCLLVDRVADPVAPPARGKRRPRGMSMLSAVELLVRDEALRARIVENAQAYVREERGLKQLREEWGYAING